MSEEGCALNGVVAPVSPDPRAPGGATSERDPDYIERHLGMIRAYTSYFSPQIRGVEHIPIEGSVTALAIVDRRGVEHPAYTLTYDMLFGVPVVGTFLRRIGAVRAGSDEAEQALAEGALVLDYPGGDWEACRPWVDRNTVDFGGRTGFVRLALRSGVPVIPVVSHGSHESVIVVSRGDRIAKALGLGGLRIKVFPILWGPLGLHTVLLPPPPLPSSITVEVLPPVDWSRFGPGDADDPAVVQHCAEEIIGLMQSALDRLNREEPHPVRRGLANLVAGVRNH
jgi:1-acyl-sn-glycerol-3-phosphate acyltransferase